MKKIWAVVLALWTGTVSAEVVDVRFFDAFGQSYQSVNIGETLAAIYNIEFDPTMVLILGPNLSDERVKQQEEIAAGLDPEEYGIMYAIGTPSQTYDRGFSISPNAAGELMPSPDAFHVIVLGADGTVLAKSDSVLPRERLLEIAPVEE